MNIPTASEKQIWNVNALIPQEIAGPQTLSKTGIALFNAKNKIFNHIGFGGYMVLRMNSSEKIQPNLAKFNKQMLSNLDLGSLQMNYNCAYIDSQII